MCGVVRTYSCGQIYEECFQNQNIKEGLYKAYSNNGPEMTEANFINGKVHTIHIRHILIMDINGLDINRQAKNIQMVKSVERIQNI